jgi:hypothetical protein
LSSGADILEREIISHHVLLTAMCGNFFNTLLARDARAMRHCGVAQDTQRKNTGLSAGHG